MCYCVSGLAFRKYEYNFDFTREREIGVFYEKWCVLCCVDFFVKYLTESCGFIFKRERDRVRDRETEKQRKRERDTCGLNTWRLNTVLF